MSRAFERWPSNEKKNTQESTEVETKRALNEGRVLDKDKEQNILVWITNLMQEGAPEKPAKNITVEDNTYWEDGKVSPEVMNLIAKTEAVQEAFKEIREKRGEMGYQDIRHMVRVAELIKFVVDTGEIVLSTEDRRDLLVAALCHDEGKTDEEVQEILAKKKGQDLSSEEREIMQKHVRAGYEFLKAHNEERAGRIALCHHEFSNEKMSSWIALHQPEKDSKRGYPRSGEDQRKENAGNVVERRIVDRRIEDREIKRLGNFLSIADKVEANGSRDRLYNKDRTAQGLVAAKKHDLSAFDSPEELLMINILERIDPNNLTQRANEEYLQEMEDAREENTQKLENHVSF